VSTGNSDWVPTAKLRWRRGSREQDGPVVTHGGYPRDETLYVLQIWYSQDVPGYMRKNAEGEWRDVPLEEATAP
jgi:hypothetical protein